MMIQLRPINGSPVAVTLAKEKLAPPPVPKPRLSDEAVAALYKGQRYGSLRMPDEPRWRPDLLRVP